MLQKDTQEHTSNMAILKFFTV